MFNSLYLITGKKKEEEERKKEWIRTETKRRIVKKTDHDKITPITKWNKCSAECLAKIAARTCRDINLRHVSLIKHRPIHYTVANSTDFHVIPPIALYDVYASNGLLDTERKVGEVTSSCRDGTTFCQVSISLVNKYI